MTIGLPVGATCRMMGHAWVTRTQYEADGPRHFEVCARCEAVNDSRQQSVYQPRHLRDR